MNFWIGHDVSVKPIHAQCVQVRCSCNKGMLKEFHEVPIPLHELALAAVDHMAEVTGIGQRLNEEMNQHAIDSMKGET